MILKDDYIWLGNGQREKGILPYISCAYEKDWVSDLWRYHIQSEVWQPMLGSPSYYTVDNAPSTMTSDYPYPRSSSNVWTDKNNNIWLYGGIFGPYADKGCKNFLHRNKQIIFSSKSFRRHVVFKHFQCRQPYLDVDIWQCSQCRFLSNFNKCER